MKGKVITKSHNNVNLNKLIVLSITLFIMRKSKSSNFIPWQKLVGWYFDQKNIYVLAIPGNIQNFPFYTAFPKSASFSFWNIFKKHPCLVITVKGLFTCALYLWLLKINSFSCIYLTHSFPMHPFSTPWKHKKTARFPDVFRGRERVHWE